VHNSTLASGCGALEHDLSQLFDVVCRATDKPSRQELIRVQIDWINGLVEPAVPAAIWSRLPRFAKCWLRNYIFAMAVYFSIGFVWAYYIYYCFGSDLFAKGNMPSWADMSEQMSVSLWALPLYSLLPSTTEELCERGYTLTYAHVSDVGVPMFIAYMVLYLAFVEFGVYWMHRGLHDIPAGYKCAAWRLFCAACLIQCAVCTPATSALYW
jgi:Delta7-sterol 5-desaturase